MDRRFFFRSLGGAVAASMLPFVKPLKPVVEYDSCGSLTRATIVHLTPKELEDCFAVGYWRMESFRKVAEISKAEGRTRPLFKDGFAAFSLKRR
jgi:hypothetical protein